MIRFTCGLLVRFVCTTAGASAPGFPCALVFNKGETDGKPRAHRAARVKRMSGRTHVITSAAKHPSFVIPGHAKREPQVRNSAPGNLEIPGSMLRIAPE
jgi:hypothetical protein